MNKETLKDEKQIALTDSNVMQLVKDRAKVVMYENMYKYENIDDLLGHHGAVFLLYQQKPNYGHWVALFRRGRNEIEYYDSYGGMIDDPLEWTSKKMRKRLNMNYPFLTKLLMEAPRHYNIIYNQYPFQKEGNDIATCGAWAAMRIQHKHLDLEEFKNLFKDVNSKITDDIVTAWRLNMKI